MGKQSLGKIKYTSQTIKNFGFDENFMFPMIVLWGYDSTNGVLSGVLRKIKVSTDGKLVVSLS